MRNVFKALRQESKRPALALVKSTTPEQEDQYSSNRHGITASEAAAALGLDPQKSPLQLWREKTGQVNPNPQLRPDKEASAGFWRTLLEPLIASVYTRRTGNRLRRINTVTVHPREPWMLSHLGWEVLGEQQAHILLCEIVGKDDLAYWSCSDGLPASLRVKAMHLLAVTGYQAADVAVLVCGQELQIHRIERDETLILKVIQAEREFWGLVKRKEVPSSRVIQFGLALKAS